MVCTHLFLPVERHFFDRMDRIKQDGVGFADPAEGHLSHIILKINRRSKSAKPTYPLHPVKSCPSCQKNTISG